MVLDPACIGHAAADIGGDGRVGVFENFITFDLARIHVRARKQKVEQQTGTGAALPVDETQAVARAYKAACTPDFFLFDRELRLVYRGQFDASRPGNGIPLSGEDLRAAMDAVIAGRPVSEDQRPSIGCNIKWKHRA